MEKLGVELPLLITQLINFTIIVVVLTKLLYNPVLKNLEMRRKKIAEGLELTETARKELELVEVKKQETLIKAKEEAKQLLENAIHEGNKLKEEIIRQGREETALIKSKMEKELKEKEKSLLAQVSSHTVEVAGEMVRRLLPEILDEKNQHKFIISQLEKIRKTHGKN